MRRRARLAMVVALMLGGGCGTIHGLDHGGAPYCGVVWDARLLASGFTSDDPVLIALTALLVPIMPFDMALSFCADTLLLPILLPVYLEEKAQREAWEEERPRVLASFAGRWRYECGALRGALRIEVLEGNLAVQIDPDARPPVPRVGSDLDQFGTLRFWLPGSVTDIEGVVRVELTLSERGALEGEADFPGEKRTFVARKE